jgi:hypothetical protein
MRDEIDNKPRAGVEKGAEVLARVDAADEESEECVAVRLGLRDAKHRSDMGDRLAVGNVEADFDYAGWPIAGRGTEARVRGGESGRPVAAKSQEYPRETRGFLNT